jgi:hypothetical protein
MNASIETERRSIEEAETRALAARNRGLEWLMTHIGSDGEPVGARERNGWARVPWALAVCGVSSTAAKIIAWAEQSQIASDGGFAPGPALGSGRFLAYPLAHFAIGAWLLERFDVALSALDSLRRLQDPATGGFPIAPPRDRGSDMYDLLSTAQVGLAAVIAGQDDIAEGAYRWITELLQAQPADAGNRLYTFRQGAQLLTRPESSLEWLAVTDFSKPRQTYYTPGMAAVFLAAHAQRRHIREPLAMGAALLDRNITGCAAQYDDLESVQLCKFGWGVAAMYAADRDPAWIPHLVRMTHWFVARQASDGSWAPSTFLQPKPSDIDRLIKTAEHVMEVNAIVAALGSALGRTNARTS